MASAHTDACLDAQILIELAGRGKWAKNYSKSMGHIARCPSCRALFKEMKEIEQARAKSLRVILRPQWRLAFAGVAAAALIVAVVRFQTNSNHSVQIASQGNSVMVPYVEKTNPVLQKNAVQRVAEKSVSTKSSVRKAVRKRPRPIDRVAVHEIRNVETPKPPAAAHSNAIEGSVVASLGTGTSSSGIAEGEVLSANTVSGTVGTESTVEGTVIAGAPDRTK